MDIDQKKKIITETISTDETGRMKRSLRFLMTPDRQDQTIREYLQKELHFSRRQISSLKYRADGIRVNGLPQRVTYVLKAGDILEIVPKSAGSLYLDHGTFTEPPVILYEDGDLLIVNKPSGIVCHPSPGHYADTLANQVAAYCAEKGENWTIRLIGRLDKDTSGAVIFAKNSETAALISQKIKTDKTYFALAEGQFPKSSGMIDLPIGPDEAIRGKMTISDSGKEAQTFYEVIADLRSCTLLKVRIEHGRTHQIRLHLAASGHPLVGDPMYGSGEPGRTHAMLHCRSVRLDHPFTGEEILAKAPFPEDWIPSLSGTIPEPELL